MPPASIYLWSLCNVSYTAPPTLGLLSHVDAGPMPDLSMHDPCSVLHADATPLQNLQDGATPLLEESTTTWVAALKAAEPAGGLRFELIRSIR